MKKFFSLLVIVVAAVVSQACASAGYTGLNGISVPGYEAAGVVAANQAMIASIAGQVGQLPYGQPLYGVPGYGNVPVCRIQDLVGLPPISVSQPVVVRVSKSKGHRTADIVGAAIVGAGLGGWAAGKTGAVYGVAAGAGGGLLVSNHEYDYCLLLPAPKP